MSTKTTEKIVESTSATTEIKTNDHKKTFGPLGKYAIIAVIMVSIIITTAIMLNKQLGSVDEQLAVIENEVAEIYAADAAESEATASSTASIETADAAETAETEVAPVEVQTAEVQAAEVAAIEAPSAEVLVATENTAEETVSEAIISTEQASSTEAAVIEAAMVKPALDKNSAKDDQAQFAMVERDQERQARIESFKLEQKQHMAEMFARIKTLEAQQLDNYKSYQDKQIERLRQQIARQEQMIEALILRNKDRFDMRAASMQRSQSNREKMLNRI